MEIGSVLPKPLINRQTTLGNGLSGETVSLLVQAFTAPELR